VMEEIADWQAGKFDDRIFTGLKDLDAMLAFPRGNLSCFGALPSAGKTVFGVQVAIHNAAKFAKEQKTDKRPCVIFFSAEMTASEIVHRMAAYVAGITENYLRRVGQNDEYDLYREAVKWVCGLPIIIDDTVGPDLDYIGAKVAQVCASRDVPLILFDHTEKAFAMGMPAEDQQTLSIVISGFKNIAKANYSHFITLHQLSRAILNRDDSYPRTSDLRGSGRLEHECFGIMLLHSELAISRHKGKLYPTELIGGGFQCTIDVTKHRNGPTGAVPVVMYPDKVKFGDLDTRSKPGQQLSLDEKVKTVNEEIDAVDPQDIDEDLPE